MEPTQQIELFRRQYFQLIDPKQLHFPPTDVLKLPQVQEEIYSTFFSEAKISFLPPARYRFRVLKALIDVLQEAFQDPEEDEISDSLTACFAELVAQPPMSDIDLAQQKSYVTYTTPIQSSEAPSITTLEARSLLAASGNTGARTWEAALRLGAYLFSDAGRHHVAGKNVLELGAGTGFLSILCAKHLDARFVLATDGSGEVVDSIQSNLHLNGLEGAGEIQADVLKWGHAIVGGMVEGQEEARHYMLILGADITYDKNSIPALVSTLRELFMQHEGIKALISATLRNEDTLKTFTDACASNRFHVERLQIPLVKEENQFGFFFSTSTPILVFMITRGEMKLDPWSTSSTEESS